MLQSIPAKRARVLEIGCGAGAFISSLTGCSETWGVEPSDAADCAKSKLTNVLRGRFDEVKQDLPRQYFDVIICNDVVEHMPNHQGFLSEVRAYLAPGGMLVGSVPNVRFYDNLFRMLFEKDWRYGADGILDRTHLAFFTEKSLRRAIETAGLQTVSIRGLNHDHLVDGSRKSRNYLLLARLLGKLTLGYFSDIRYFQYAFQAIPKKL
jgi:2-polyprenyl-3-methyl-5-hydroxy-6-metoxy-1,4-benzoquinol methylase